MANYNIQCICNFCKFAPSMIYEQIVCRFLYDAIYYLIYMLDLDLYKGNYSTYILPHFRTPMLTDQQWGMDTNTEANTTKTLRNLLEQFKPTLLNMNSNQLSGMNGNQLSGIPSPDSSLPAFLYRVGNASSVTSSSASPSMVVKSNTFPLEDHTIRRTRTVIPYSVKCQITKLAEENPRITQGEIAQVFGIDRTTVSKILKRRREFVDDSTIGETSPKPKVGRFTYAMINEKHEEEVYNWYKKLKEKNVMVTQTMILEAAETLAANFGVSRLDFSKQWLHNFLDKYQVTCKDVFMKDDDSEYDHMRSM